MFDRVENKLDGAILKVLTHPGVNTGDTPTSIATRLANSPAFCCPVGGETWAVLYRNSSGYPSLRIVSKSGNAISAGSEHVIVSTSEQVYGLYPHPNDSDKVVCVHGSDMTVATWSGTAFTADTQQALTYGASKGFMPFPDNPDEFACFDASGTTLQYEKVNVSGTTMTLGDSGTLTSAATAIQNAGVISEDRGFVTDEVSATQVGCNIFSISGGTLSRTSMPSDSMSVSGSSAHTILHSHGNKGVYSKTDPETEDALIAFTSYPDASANVILNVMYFDRSGDTLTRITPQEQTLAYFEQSSLGVVGEYFSNYPPIVMDAHNGFGVITFSGQFFHSLRILYGRLDTDNTTGAFACSFGCHSYGGNGGAAEEVVALAVDNNLQYGLLLHTGSSGTTALHGELMIFT